MPRNEDEKRSEVPNTDAGERDPHRVESSMPRAESHRPLRAARADAEESLADLHLRADAHTDGSAGGRTASSGWTAHAAVLDRLAANVREAMARGWTSCAIERSGGAGRFTAWGVPPGSCQRHSVPDWATDPESRESA